ncbi:NAD(P)-dependent alcohol dehydrogenase [Cohnella cholangitidis]|uniref:NAD(P)-dependent alcohol dehydrogenase n=1 Tax=Cohnella cholangitidis TaxID=2598458 RepID=A0A7G5BUS1_9BACL|nr:NAD(P)-dependent alcohol dehydrogenase [Cohnella cholangitidis]QMV40705.1 NAD(P)-dependent alcohol dehydrogenase [Cohnella cholangitidis]
MKAVVCTKYGPPEVLQLKETEKPAPKENEICIKIFASSVTASDCIIRGFKVPMRFWLPMALAIGLKKPRKSILGMVFAGEVESVGANTQTFKKGDQVYGIDRFGFGSYAEYKCIREDGVLVKKSANAKYEEAAAIPFGGLLALHYLKKGNLQKGQKILVYGASGAVGTAAVQLARHLGAEVTGVCSTANLELVKSLGAHTVIDYTKEDFTEKGELYDLIFNAVGKAKATLQCKNVLVPNGKQITVDDGSPPLRSEDLIWLNGLMEQGRIKAVIDRHYPLEQIVDAHSYVDKGHKKGNVIITVEHSH